MQYKIVKKEYSVYLDAGDIELFELDVNAFCQEGWKTIGGVTVNDEGNHKWLLQAMIKEDEEDNLKEKDMGFFESLMNADEII